MGKVLGGGSSINLMIWARGHQRDWDYFAAEADDEAWNYESVLDIYRRVEDWHGAPDPDYRGRAARFTWSLRRTPTRWHRPRSRLAAAVGIPTFESHNGR